MITVTTRYDGVHVTYSHPEGAGFADATGTSLTEAIEKLVIRFKEMQDAALEELRERGFIRVERTLVEVSS